MKLTEYDLPTPNGAAQPALPAASGDDSGGPEPVRILVYGNEDAVRQIIRQLHVLRFVEQYRWTPIIAMPPNGIFIAPDTAEHYSFLVKEVR